MAKMFHNVVTKVIVDPSGMDAGLKSAEDKARTSMATFNGALGKASGYAGQLSGSINSVATATNALNQSSQSWLSTITHIGAGFAMGGAIGAAIGGISALADYVTGARERTKQLSQEMEEAINTANTFGITVNQFTGIRFAGLVEGVNPEKMEKLLIAVNEVADSEEKLGKIGLSTAQLANKSQYERIMMIVDAWKKATETVSGLNTVMDQVGKKSFAALNPLIQLGSEGLNKNGVGIPGYMAEALDRMGDKVTILEQQKKMEEIRVKYMANLQQEDQPWYLRWFGGANAQALVNEHDMQNSQLQDIRDRRQKEDQIARERAVKAAQYSFAGNAWDFGPTGEDIYGGGLAMMMAKERSLGLSATRPITSTLAGATDLNTFAGQQALQQMLQREGGGTKTIEERMLAIQEADQKKQDEQLQLQRDWKAYYEANGVNISPAPAF